MTVRNEHRADFCNNLSANQTISAAKTSADNLDKQVRACVHVSVCVCVCHVCMCVVCSGRVCVVYVVCLH